MKVPTYVMQAENEEKKGPTRFWNKVAHLVAGLAFANGALALSGHIPLFDGKVLTLGGAPVLAAFIVGWYGSKKLWMRIGLESYSNFNRKVALFGYMAVFLVLGTSANIHKNNDSHLYIFSQSDSESDQQVIKILGGPAYAIPQDRYKQAVNLVEELKRHYNPDVLNADLVALITNNPVAFEDLKRIVGKDNDTLNKLDAIFQNDPGKIQKRD